MKKGKFLSIDGVDGAGKSTQIDFICDYLQQKNIKIIRTREPGGTVLGDKIRQLLLANNHKMHTDTELLLLFAARNEHIKQHIEPILASGSWILSDRFTDASYAYQGGGRGQSSKRIAELERWVLGDFAPDMTFLLDVDAKISMQRVTSRGEKNHIELEDFDFFKRVRDAYISRAEQFPERIKLIDASQNITKTYAQIRKVLDLL